MPEAVRHQRGILDTRTVILLPRMEDALLLPEQPLITAITLAELTVGPLVATSDEGGPLDRRTSSRPKPTSSPFPSIPPPHVPLDRVAASLRRSGRKTSARSYDAMIAATAIANELPLYTCNPADFAGIAGLEVVSVPVPP